MVVKRLVPVLAALASSGVGVLLTQQFAHVALALANTAYILEGGRIRYHGTSIELRENPEQLRSAYLLETRGLAQRQYGCRKTVTNRPDCDLDPRS